MKNSIVITGFMGTGKSSVGQKVALSLGKSFVDTDELIEETDYCYDRDILVEHVCDHEYTQAGLIDESQRQTRVFCNQGCRDNVCENTKNMDKYSERHIFLVSNKNWRDVLSLVPVTTWTKQTEESFLGPLVKTNIESEIIKYPTLMPAITCQRRALYLRPYY